jgi:hypothetical protein
MAKGDRTFSMLLEVKNGALEENLTVEEEDTGGIKKKIRHQKLLKRTTKKDYRDYMKDPSKFAYTHIANPDHPTIAMRESGPHDEVSFYCFEKFVISFQPHPDVIEDGDAPDGPFTKGGVEFTMDTAKDQGAPPRPDRYKAGPYAVATKASNQKFWKFLIVTDSGLTMDPCIVTE